MDQESINVNIEVSRVKTPEEQLAMPKGISIFDPLLHHEIKHSNLFAGNVRTDQIELVLLAVVGAVADQGQRDFIVGLRFARDLAKRFG